MCFTRFPAHVSARARIKFVYLPAKIIDMLKIGARTSVRTYVERKSFANKYATLR